MCTYVVSTKYLYCVFFFKFMHSSTIRTFMRQSKKNNYLYCLEISTKKISKMMIRLNNNHNKQHYIAVIRQLTQPLLLNENITKELFHTILNNWKISAHLNQSWVCWCWCCCTLGKFESKNSKQKVLFQVLPQNAKKLRKRSQPPDELIYYFWHHFGSNSPIVIWAYLPLLLPTHLKSP